MEAREQEEDDETPIQSAGSDVGNESLDSRQDDEKDDEVDMLESSSEAEDAINNPQEEPLPDFESSSNRYDIIKCNNMGQINKKGRGTWDFFLQQSAQPFKQSDEEQYALQYALLQQCTQPAT